MPIPERSRLLYGPLFLVFVCVSIWWFAVEAPRRAQERAAEEFQLKQNELMHAIDLQRMDQIDNRRKANISRIESRSREVRREFWEECQELRRTWERDMISEIPRIQPDYSEIVDPLGHVTWSYSGPNSHPHFFYWFNRTPQSVERDLRNEFDDILMEAASAPPP